MDSLSVLRSFETQEMQVEALPWPELADEPLPSFPAALLPDSCARLVEAVAASLPVPVDYAACALLGAASAALVGRVAIQPRQGHTEPVQLYLCLGGESGTNKSGPMRLFIAPLEQWLTQQRKDVLRRNRDKAMERDVLVQQASQRNTDIQKRLALHHQAEEIVDDPEPEVIMTDATPESLARRMKRQGGCGILYTDEGAFINILAGATYGKQGGATNLDTVLKGFDGGRVYIERVGAECIDIERAHLSITVGMQPSIIERMTGDANLADRGFPQRVLFFLPEPLIGVKLQGLPMIPQEDMEAWSRLLIHLAATRRGQCAILPMTKRAQTVYEQHRQDMADRVLGDMGGSRAMQAWARKAHGKTARLALLLALLEDPDAAIVEESHVRSAVAMMNDYFIPHMKKAFGGGASLSPDAMALLDVLRDAAQFSQADLLHRVSGQKKYKGNGGKAHFQEVLQELAAGGYIRQAEAESTGRGRKPSPLWEVHPALWQKRSTVPITEGELS